MVGGGQEGEQMNPYWWVVAGWLVVAALTFAVLRLVVAPYGRHSRKGWGPTLHRTAGWVIMESPAVWGFVLFYLLGNRHDNAVGLVFLGLWMWHYVNRTLIFPFRLRGGETRMPLLIVAMGFLFNLVNSYIQGHYLYAMAPVPEVSWLWDGRFLAGAALFLAGWAINVHADGVLRNLRKPGESAYRIPNGGLYRWVSCPNYFGELMEWAGWALATWSPAGLVFLLWTAANLLPRARAHHAWYLSQFPEYPKARRAAIPFLLSL
jgi:protein-S-isoprenylcysteine O-methyltransferase Ste14